MMEAFGPRTLLVAFALHALLLRAHPDVTLGEAVEDAITAADMALDAMALQRK